MSRRLWLVVLVFCGSTAFAWQPAFLSPSEIVISGSDSKGGTRFSIRATLSMNKGRLHVRALSVTGFEETFEVSEDLLADVADPDFKISSVTLDSGKFGPVMGFLIPFGKAPICKQNREHTVSRMLDIYIVRTQAGDFQLRESVFDPCA